MTAETIAGVCLAFAFGIVALTAARRALYVLAVVGALQLFQAFVFAGSRIQQGLFPIEVMASVAALLVALRVFGGERLYLAREIDRPFFALLAIAALSLVVNLFWVDPAINVAHGGNACSQTSRSVPSCRHGTTSVVLRRRSRSARLPMRS